MSLDTADASCSTRVCRPSEQNENFQIGFLASLPDPVAKRTHASDGTVIKHLMRSSLGLQRFILALGLRGYSLSWQRGQCLAGNMRWLLLQLSSENRERTGMKSSDGPAPDGPHFLLHSLPKQHHQLGIQGSNS